jgi:hypothetical protein
LFRESDIKWLLGKSLFDEVFRDQLNDIGFANNIGVALADNDHFFHMKWPSLQAFNK